MNKIMEALLIFVIMWGMSLVMLVVFIHVAASDDYCKLHTLLFTSIMCIICFLTPFYNTWEIFTRIKEPER